MLGDGSFVEGHLLRLFIGADAHYQGRPLHVALLELLLAEGIAGASVFRGVEGFGAHREIHLNRLFALGAKAPLVVEIVDSAERIAAIVPKVEAMVDEGTITLERVEYRRFARSR
jgi:PII-like signaling protein